jgi:hypothetical protein
MIERNYSEIPRSDYATIQMTQVFIYSIPSIMGILMPSRIQ